MPITNVTFKTKLYKSEPLEDGSYPIVIQINWTDNKSNTRRKRLGVSCQEIEFDKESGFIKNTAWRSKLINQEIQSSLNKAFKIYYNEFSSKEWNYVRWAALFSKDSSEEITFDKFTKSVVQKLNLINKAGTATFYQDACRAMQKFLKKDNIEFSEITKATLRGLEDDYIQRGFKGDRTMRGLKGIFSKAVEQEVIDLKLMPFKTGYNPTGYKFTHLKKIVKTSKMIKRLSPDQVKIILDYKPKNESEEKALDLWKFSYFTMGVNLKDIALMKYSDIQNGLWFYNRSKTNNSSLGKPLLNVCTNIIAKYYNPENKYVFDFILKDCYDLNDESINKRKRDILANLRKRYLNISKAIGLNGYFTFYSARYTSATISVNRGADMRAVQANLTHASIATTEIYSQFRNEELMRRSLELLKV